MFLQTSQRPTCIERPSGSGSGRGSRPLIGWKPMQPIERYTNLSMTTSLPGANSDNAMRRSRSIAPGGGHKAVEWKSERPLAVGSKIAFVAEFMGRRLAYTYEVNELVP